MADVGFGFVHDFGAGEEFVAEREPRRRSRRRAAPRARPGYGLEVVGLEATKPELILPIVAGLRGKAYRCRAVGSLAITALLRRRRTLRRDAQRPRTAARSTSPPRS